MHSRNKPVVGHGYDCTATSQAKSQDIENVTLSCTYSSTVGEDSGPPEEATMICPGSLAKYLGVSQIFMKQDTINSHDTFYSLKTLVSTSGLFHVMAYKNVQEKKMNPTAAFLISIFTPQ